MKPLTGVRPTGSGTATEKTLLLAVIPAALLAVVIWGFTATAIWYVVGWWLR